MVVRFPLVHSSCGSLLHNLGPAPKKAISCADGLYLHGTTALQNQPQSTYTLKDQARTPQVVPMETNILNMNIDPALWNSCSSGSPWTSAMFAFSLVHIKKTLHFGVSHILWRNSTRRWNDTEIKILASSTMLHIPPQIGHYITHLKPAMKMNYRAEGSQVNAQVLISLLQEMWNAFKS